MAGESVARAEAAKLASVLRGLGVRVSIELQQGRGEWHVPKLLVMNHHVASRPTAENPTPGLYTVKHGREDLVGPLANGYGGFDYVFRIITMGEANHSGLGGPLTVDGIRLVKDAARRPTYGIEWEGGYGEWTAAFRRFMATCNLGITRYLRRPPSAQLEHSTWAPGRKIDRRGYTREISIRETVEAANSLHPVPGAQPQEDDMILFFRAPGKGNAAAIPGVGVVTFSTEADRTSLIEQVKAVGIKAITHECSPGQWDAYMRAGGR